MAKTLQETSPAQLLEEFRSVCRALNNASSQEATKALSTRADLLEQEILRRMAW